jgi:hypothetical protein
MTIRVLMVALAAVGLIGCSPSTLDPSTLAALNAALSTAATQCRFLPTVETVLSLLTVANPAVAAGEAVGEGICKALPPAPTKGAAAFPNGPPVVQGVQIRGQYLNTR